MTAGLPIRRRRLLAGAALAPLAGAVLAPLAGCGPKVSAYAGGWVGANVERGHRLREKKSAALPVPEVQRRAGAIVVGAGISGLAAARALAAAGIDDVQLLELEDEVGGNSRGHEMAGMRCPLGAHYLPLPGEQAVEVIELLEALDLRRSERGVPVYDERNLCHSPQERLYIGGMWHDGLLPPVAALPAAERAITSAQYRQFGTEVEAAASNGAFAMPTARAHWSARLDALDAVTFAAWLDARGLTAPALRWYLDYCCRDDYGAGAAQVSAWAGLHYFASRHGFHPPGGDNRASNAGIDTDTDAVLTWPEGNAWLTRQMAAPLAGRLHTGRVVLRIREGRDDVDVDVWNADLRRAERWTAPQVVLAVPLFVAVRLLPDPLAALVRAAATMQHAPWLVTNLQLTEALDGRPGAPLSWDNVIFEPGKADPALGYVDAMHQSTRQVPGATVLTHYWALGGESLAQLAARRTWLLTESWSTWSAAVVGDLARVHPDLPGKLARVDLMRYGHAMAVPTPGLRSGGALRALAEAQRRIQFAHADLSAYSVFEEAIYQGTRAGRNAARLLNRLQRG